MLVLSILVICYSKELQYMRYMKVFLDENPKTRFLYMNKIRKIHKIFKISSKKTFLIDLVWQLLILFVSWRCCDPSAHTDVFKK